MIATARTLTGLFLVIPCMDSITKVDLRTISFDIAPQEVKCTHNFFIYVCYTLCLKNDPTLKRDSSKLFG